MKTTAFSLAFGALVATSAVADQVRVTVRVIEVPHTVLTKWTEGGALKGQDLHDRAVKLASEGEAEIVETSVLTVRSGEKGLLESIAEILYPTEQEPSSLGSPNPTVPLDARLPAVPFLRPAYHHSFESRNTGTTVEIEPSVSADGAMVDLRLSFELVDRASNEVWMEFRDQWGDASVKFPIFDTRRLNGAITLVPGAFELFNTFTPKPNAVPAAVTRQLVFVCADVIASPQKP